MATFTPGIAIDPTTGEEVISFDTGHFDDGIGRNAAIARHMQSHQAQYVEAPDGQVRHEWADLDPEIYQRYEHDYVDPDEYGEQFEDMDLTENDQEYLQDIVGGSEAYQELITWASNVLSPDDIQAYDQIMQSGDVGDMEEAVRWLYEQYSNYDPSIDSSSDSVVDAVYDAIPNYDDIIEWASRSLGEQAIAEYDSVMESGDDDLVYQYVNQLVELYNESEYESEYE
jgi:hypothetical protein